MLFHCAPYLPAALILPYALKRIPAKLQFVIAFFISFIGQGLMGTSLIFGYPERIELICCGMLTLGFIIAVLAIQSLPEVINQIHLEYKIIKGVDPELDAILLDT